MCGKLLVEILMIQYIYVHSLCSMLCFNSIYLIWKLKLIHNSLIICFKNINHLPLAGNRRPWWPPLAEVSNWSAWPHFLANSIERPCNPNYICFNPSPLTHSVRTNSLYLRRCALVDGQVFGQRSQRTLQIAGQHLAGRVLVMLLLC